MAFPPVIAIVSFLFLFFVPKPTVLPVFTFLSLVPLVHFHSFLPFVSRAGPREVYIARSFGS